MNIIFLCSLICLSSSSVINQLAPLKVITNQSLITIAPLMEIANKQSIDVMSHQKDHMKMANKQLIDVIMDHQKDPAYLLSVLSNVNPTQLDAVIVLIQALLADSESDLDAVTLASTNANKAYTDATVAYDAVVLAKVRLETAFNDENVRLETAYTAQSAVLDQQVKDLFVVQTEALGAKTNAQDTLDTEATRLNGEITTLKQVIALLGGLPTSGFKLEHQCTAGRYRGTQFTEAQTPTIKDCEKICRDEDGCVGFTYGNVALYKGDVSGTAYTSDGGRANDCIMSNAPFDFISGWEATCRWNTYSLTA